MDTSKNLIKLQDELGEHQRKLRKISVRNPNYNQIVEKIDNIKSKIAEIKEND